MNAPHAATGEALPSSQSEGAACQQFKEERGLTAVEGAQSGWPDENLPLSPALQLAGEGTLVEAHAGEDREPESQQQGSTAPAHSGASPASGASEPYAAALRAFADAMWRLPAAEAAKAAHTIAEERAVRSEAVAAAAAAEFAALLYAAIGTAYSPQGADSSHARTELLTLRNALVERDRELAALRLRNLQRTQHAQTAPTVAPKAQHEGEGMHALDFEQLTIEAQSMTEKSEARALTVVSLKAKRTTAVQVHAHVEWKLHAVKNMRSVTIARLEEARAALAAQHAELRGLKASRDRERGAIKRLEEAQQHVAPHALLQNIEAQRQQVPALQDSNAELQAMIEGRFQAAPRQ